ncbi:MAG: phosphate signaling complex protein PhoU [Longimicrobiales bacterium]|nr:phosphate signaling complex protein PhoU [Longimicrobiales bacterium]
MKGETPGRMRHFHQELDTLQERLMEMAGMAEELVGVAFQAVVEKDRSVAKYARAKDEEIDDLEVAIEEQVTELLALHQPVATDLRQVISALKMSNDIERVGDHAVNIARAAKRLAKAPPLPETRELGEMAVIARAMLSDALAAYIARDPATARVVCVTDDKVDNLRRSLFRILLTYMLEEPRMISGALELLRISQSLERVADLATNISEDVVYLVEGRSMKHGRLESPADYDSTDEADDDEGDATD